METSAARNAGLPSWFSGARCPSSTRRSMRASSCNPYLYVNAWVPEQQVPPIVDHFMKANNAKSFFLIGQRLRLRPRHAGIHPRLYREDTAAKWSARNICRWTAAIGRRSSPNCSASGADALDHLDGRRRAECHAHQAIARRRRSTLPYGNLAVDEGTAKSMGTDAEGIFISASYVTGDRHAANKKFLADMKAKFGDH